jgi:hypothetical protein
VRYQSVPKQNKGRIPHDGRDNKTCARHEVEIRTCGICEARYAKYETGPTHAQLVRTTRRHG